MNLLNSTIVETYINKDSSVVKYVHANGAETTVKTISTCVNHNSYINTNKVVIFVSSSVGCKAACKFCYLTTKKFRYEAIPEHELIDILKNVIEASKDILKGKYLKLSFMGMGDAFYDKIDIVRISTIILKYAYKKNFVLGIDGVDVATIYPKINNSSMLTKLSSLNAVMYTWDIPFNPITTYNKLPEHDKRTVVRLFISLHSLKNNVRTFLMPQALDVNSMFRKLSGVFVDIVFHYMPIQDVNDNAAEVADIKYAFSNRYKNYELRLLQFNECPGSELKRSVRTDAIIDIFKSSSVKFKYQISPGDEMLAACGQFICRDIT